MAKIVQNLTKPHTRKKIKESLGFTIKLLTISCHVLNEEQNHFDVIFTSYAKKKKNKNSIRENTL